MGWNSLSRTDLVVVVRRSNGSGWPSTLEEPDDGIFEASVSTRSSSTGSDAPVRIGRNSGSLEAMMGLYYGLQVVNLCNWVNVQLAQGTAGQVLPLASALRAQARRELKAPLLLPIGSRRWAPIRGLKEEKLKGSITTERISTTITALRSCVAAGASLSYVQSAMAADQRHMLRAVYIRHPLV